MMQYLMNINLDEHSLNTHLWQSHTGDHRDHDHSKPATKRHGQMNLIVPERHMFIATCALCDVDDMHTCLRLRDLYHGDEHFSSRAPGEELDHGPTDEKQYLEVDVPKVPCTLESVGSKDDA